LSEMKLFEPEGRPRVLPKRISRRRQQLPPLSIIRALWKRKLIIGLTWLVVTAVGAGIVLKLPSVYRSETLILVESQRIPEKFVAPTVSMDLRDRLSTLSQQILSYRRLREIIQKYNLYQEEQKDQVEEEIVEMMRNDIAIRVVEESAKQLHPSAFRVSYQGPNPTVVAQVANQLGNLFVDENLRAREVHAVGTSEFLETQVVESKKRLEEQEATLSKYKLLHNGELPQQEGLLVSNVARMQTQFQGATDALQRAQQNKLMVDNALAAAEASVTAMTQIIDELSSGTTAVSPSGPEPVKTSTVLERQLAVMVTRYTQDHPEVQKLKKTLQVVRDLETKGLPVNLGEVNDATSSQLATAGGGGTVVTADPARPKATRLSEILIRERERIENLKSQQAVADKQIESIAEERQRIQGDLENVQKRIQRLPMREQELAGVMRDYEITRANYQSLLDKKIAAEMAAEMERRQKAERFTVLDAARTPEKPIRPNRPLLGMLISIGGLAFGLVFAVGVEFRRNTILGEWEFPPTIPVLGRVPTIAGSGKKGGREGKGQEAEAGRRFGWKRLVLVSSLVLMLVGIVFATLVFMGWIPLGGVMRLFAHAAGLPAAVVLTEGI
jgi:polysaccharide biosynthesis transport protein